MSAKQIKKKSIINNTFQLKPELWKKPTVRHIGITGNREFSALKARTYQARLMASYERVHWLPWTGTESLMLEYHERV